MSKLYCTYCVWYSPATDFCDLFDSELEDSQTDSCEDGSPFCPECESEKLTLASTTSTRTVEDSLDNYKCNECDNEFSVIRSDQ